jgi:hypothetical protein
VAKNAQPRLWALQTHPDGSRQSAPFVGGPSQGGPPGLTLSRLSPTAIQVALSAQPDTGRSVIGYEIQWSPDGVSNWTTVPTPDPVAPSEIPPQDTRPPTKYLAMFGSLPGVQSFNSPQVAFDSLVPGDVLAINGDTFSQRVVMTRNGTPLNPIYVKPLNYANRPRFDGLYSSSVIPGWGLPADAADRFSAGRTQLFSLMANWVSVDGIDFANSLQGGILVGPANNNANFINADQVNTFYTGNRIIRCSVIGSETAFRTINVDGLDVLGCEFRDCQRAFFRTDGFPEDNPTWGSAVSLMGKRINFIETTVGQSSGEGIHLGIHIRFGQDAPNAFIQCEDVVVRNCRLFDCWSAPLYVSNVDRGIVERNVIWMTSGPRYWQYASNGYPKYCIDIASESGDPGKGGWPPPHGFIGARDLIIRNNIATGALYCMRFTNWPLQNTRRVKVIGNTFYRPVGGTFSEGASLIANEESELSDLEFQDNIVYAEVPEQMCRTWLTPGGTWTKGANLFSTAPPAALADPSNVISAAQPIVDPTYSPSGTYPATSTFDTSRIRLIPTSPAVNAGRVLADLPTDFFGNPRPTESGKFDIGAHSLSKPLNMAFVDPGAAAGSPRFYRARYTQSDLAVKTWSAAAAAP